MTEKGFKRVEEFKGEEAKWKNWAFKFKTATRAQELMVVQVMEEVEKMEEEVETDDNFDIQRPGINCVARAAELYEVLCMMCTGEALNIVQGVGQGDGFAAWQKLHSMYCPRTAMKVMGKLVEVVTPKKITDMKEVRGTVEKWAAKVKEMDTEYGEKLSDKMKMAILMSMCPGGIQDTVFQQMAEGRRTQRLRTRW